jgi:hypothetical protein
MKFELVSTKGREENVADALQKDLVGQLEKLPLERFCMRGGWPLNVVIGSVTILQDHREKLVATLKVSFTETGAACCSGDNFEHEHFEELSLVIDKQDWSCQFPIDDGARPGLLKAGSG